MGLADAKVNHHITLETLGCSTFFALLSFFSIYFIVVVLNSLVISYLQLNCETLRASDASCFLFSCWQLVGTSQSGPTHHTALQENCQQGRSSSHIYCGCHQFGWNLLSGYEWCSCQGHGPAAISSAGKDLSYTSYFLCDYRQVIRFLLPRWQMRSVSLSTPWVGHEDHNMRHLVIHGV